MLPDYPKTKRFIREKFQKEVKKEIRKNPLLSLLQYKEVHEGKTYCVRSMDGYIKKGVYKEISSGFKISNEEMILKGPEAIFSRVKEAADEMINQTHKDVLREMDEATKRTGNVVSAKSKTITPELVLAALDKVALDFDDCGFPIMPALVVSPPDFEALQKAVPEWLLQPLAIKRYELMRKIIIEKKRQEWIDRENNRKLVE